MRDLLLPAVLIACVLAIPIVPFVLMDESIDSWLTGQFDEDISPSVVAGVVVAGLATDVFLPVPSSMLSTVAGNQLGFFAGTAVSWLGMTLGALFAFALARLFGRRLALWLSGRDDLARTDRLAGRFGPMVLVVTRPVPLLAEASVLLLGATDLPWRRFLAPIALSNLGIAAAYAALGNLVQLPIALAASIALPLLAAVVARRLWPADEDEVTST